MSEIAKYKIKLRELRAQVLPLIERMNVILAENKRAYRAYLRFEDAPELELDDPPPDPYDDPNYFWNRRENEDGEGGKV